VSSQDTVKLKDFVTEAKKLNDAGGDWDRRNRLKVRLPSSSLCIFFYTHL
jgi:hypothetical protein